MQKKKQDPGGGRARGAYHVRLAARKVGKHSETAERLRVPRGRGWHRRKTGPVRHCEFLDFEFFEGTANTGVGHVPGL